MPTYGSEIRIGFEGTYDAVLDELEDLPSQFIGDVSDGRCDLGAIFTEDTGTNRSSEGAGDLDLGDLSAREVLAMRGDAIVVVVAVLDIARAPLSR